VDGGHLHKPGWPRVGGFRQIFNAAKLACIGVAEIPLRAIDLLLRTLGEEAGITISAHILRHTCLTNLIRQGNDVVLVAEIAGHRRLETTRRYSLPTDQDRAAAMEALRVDY
jgi:integrase/recombinase XerC